MYVQTNPPTPQPLFQRIPDLAQRLKQWIKTPLPPRLLITHAVIGTLTVKIPTNLLISGSIEILVSDVRLSATITPAVPPSPPLSPHLPRRSSVDSDTEDDDEDHPTTAEDLARSFLHSQPLTEQEQLLKSLYRDRKPDMAASYTTSAASDDEDDDELGVGTSVGLPKILANMFKGIGDRLKVQIRGVVVSLETYTPDDQKVVVELEVEDVDVEGVTTTTPSGGDPRRRKEGKRCITLDNIKAYVTSEASLFEPPGPPAASTVFGEASEVTERMGGGDMAASRDTVRETVGGSMAGSTNTLRNYNSPPQPPSPVRQSPSPKNIYTPPPTSLQPHKSDQDSDAATSASPSFDDSLYSESDRFADFEDSDDEEVLAFAPSFSASRIRSGSRLFPRPRVNYDEDDEDEDSEDEGGAAFAPSVSPGESPRVRSPVESRGPSPPVSRLTSSSHTRSASSSRVISPSPEMAMITSPVQPPDPYGSDTENSESGDEMDADASKMLSESTLFTHSEAGSLYLSATSGLLGEERLDEEEKRIKDKVDEELVGDEEMDERLDALLGIEAPFTSSSSSPSPTPELPPETVDRDDSNAGEAIERRIRKRIFNLDRIEIFVPSLSAEDSTAVVPRAEESRSSNVEDSHYPHVPGAFSMYATRRGPSDSPSSSPPRARRQTMVKIIDAKSESTASVLDLSVQAAKPPDVEVEIGRVGAELDFATARVLGMVLEAVTGAMGDVEVGKRKGDAEVAGGVGPGVEVVVSEVGLKLVERLRGVYLREEAGGGEEEEVHTEGAVVVECLFREIKVTHSTLAANVTTTKVVVKTFTLGDGKENILSFVPPPPPPPTAKARKRGSNIPITPLFALDNDITFIISQSPSKKRINVTTLPIKLHFDLKRLEATLGAFGGVGGVLASTSTTASTVTLTKPPPKKWSRGVQVVEPETKGDTKVACAIGGLVVEIVGTTGKIGLETSAVKVRSESKGSGGVVVTLDRIGIYAPDLPWERPGQQVTTSVMVENTRVEFLGSPVDEDLARLLELLTPSKDQFADDDDILIDTLLRQRQQGSALRVGIAAVKVLAEDLAVLSRLRGIGEEIVKVLTVTDFVTQDERPGLLTLLRVDEFQAHVEVGSGVGRVEVDVRDVGVAHVSLPSLVAVALGKIRVRRNGSEELLGEALEGKMRDKVDEGKHMLMLRIVGDEPEPVVKLKLWNVRVEYRVETLMALTNTPAEKVTAEVLANEMVQSVISVAEKNMRDEGPPLGVDVLIRDCVLGLNPLGLKSRGLVVLTDSRLQAALPSRGLLSAGVDVRKAFVMLIDDTANLLPASEPRRRKPKVNRHHDGLTSLGYVSVVEVSSAKVTLKVVDTGENGDKAIDLEVHDDLLLMESCADSTQTLLAIVNGLKPPLVEDESVKYCTQVMEVDMFRSLTEHAFSIPKRAVGEWHPDDDDDGDMIGDDVPTNLTFVESYYGAGGKADAYTKDELADSMLDEDLGSIAPRPRKPLGVGEKGTFATFTEQVGMCDEDPLAYVENHFGQIRVRRISEPKKPAVGDTVATWDSVRNQYVISTHPQRAYFPLRVKVRDVHLIWNLHDGYDWPRTRDTISAAVKRVEYKAAQRRDRRVSFDVDEDEESVIGDFLFNSIYIGIPAKSEPGGLTKALAKEFDDHGSETSYSPSTANDSSRPSSRSRNTEFAGPGARAKNLKLSRSKTHKLQFELKGVCVDFLLFPPEAGETQSSVDVRVRDLEIIDNVPTSTWKKFVTYMQDAGGRETGSNMVHLEVMNVRPVPELAASELVLKVCLVFIYFHPILQSELMPDRLLCCRCDFMLIRIRSTL